MFDEMTSRTVLITGASGGIGAAAAEAFAEKGYNLILQYNSRSAEELAEKLKGRGVSACAIKADLSRQQDIEKLAEEAKDVYCDDCREHEKLGGAVANAKYLIKYVSDKKIVESLFYPKLNIGYIVKKGKNGISDIIKE